MRILLVDQKAGGGAGAFTMSLAAELSRQHDVCIATAEQRDDFLHANLVLRSPGKNRLLDPVNGIPRVQIGFDWRFRLLYLLWLCTVGILVFPLYYFTRLPSLRRLIWTCIDFVVRRGYRRGAAEAMADVDVVYGFTLYRYRFLLSFLDGLGERPFLFTPFLHTSCSWAGDPPAIDIFRRADGILVCTRTERELLFGLGIPPRRVRVIGGGPGDVDLHRKARTDVGALKRRLGLERHVVLFVGRVSVTKGALLLLEAAERVFERVPDVSFVFAGGIRGDCGAALGRSGDPRIVLVGHVTGDPKFDLYEVCDIFVLPSEEESFGVVYSEAWAFGKPVIARRIPALEHVIDDGKDGLLVARDSAELADAIVRLLRDPELCRRMGERGRRKVEQVYNWRVAGEQVTGLVLEVVGG